LLQLSVAVHVRVIVFSWGQLPAATLLLALTTGLESQVSVAVALPVADTSVAATTLRMPAKQSALPGSGLQSIVASAGQVIVGAVLSITEIT
jgi:hypothetical protein